ncbi:MAG: hypothetical protein GC145_05780 [Caulobacter sp.]|nr:hypothetical protein [Caulobacter sp.]
MSSWILINFAFTFLVTGFAAWKGGPPERLSAWFLLLATLLTFVLPDRRWIDVQFAVMWLDILAFGLFICLALFADRWWPLWTAGFQGICVIIHLAFWAQNKVMSLAYMTGLNIIGYAVVTTVGLGALAHVRRQRRARSESSRTVGGEPKLRLQRGAS